ncbi:hypothetical protein [Bacillus sp. FJAT-29937]|uniref:hypothetical protein n=1 Tax=Bacillus sp. FJAT-29937 TaxID=1720553 RepID=UPI000833F9C2|nr:hypothetical protein [Bacillus sp. FJAT-29937]
MRQGLWNDHFREYLESCAEVLADGGIEHFYKNHVRTEYIQKYWDIRFEEYYQQITCPVLFLPSEEESKNPKIRHSLNYFVSLLDEYEVYQIEGSIHAYVWMQHPIESAGVVKVFLEQLQIKG